MMKRLVFNDPKTVLLVDAMIPGEKFSPNLPSIGLLENGKLVGGVVYNQYTGNGIAMHVAGLRKGWITRRFIRAAFEFPFVYLGCARVTGLVRTDNPVALDFDKRLGFVEEGVIRKGDDDGCDLILLGMLKEECRWIRKGE
nr:MAG TPA: acetyltransferase [Caudoviricetes sp.]